jgi:hypothetical protein
MQCILREKLLAQAIKLAEVSNIYRTESHQFVDAYLNWLEQAEKDFSSLRSPISILLQAERNSVGSVIDGNLPLNIQSGMSARKNQRVAATQSLEKVSKEIYSKIEAIDDFLEQFNEKLCHAVAVVASKQPETYSKLEATQHGVDTIWKMLGSVPEVVPMYNYFSARLAVTDRNYLLMNIIQNMLSNKVEMD